MDKEINVKKLFLLWEIMAELESVLWDIYFDEFMQLCIETPPDSIHGPKNKDIPF
jgi:hypothetical protein